MLPCSFCLPADRNQTVQEIVLYTLRQNLFGCTAEKCAYETGLSLPIVQWALHELLEQGLVGYANSTKTLWVAEEEALWPIRR